MDNNPFAPLDAVTTTNGSQPTQENAFTSHLPDPDQLVQGVVTGIESTVPGVDWILQLLGAAKDLPTLVADIIKETEAQHPLQYLPALIANTKKLGRVLEIVNSDAWSVMSDVTIGPIFTSMLESGLGIKMSEFDSDELSAVNTVDTMIGFATALPLIISGLQAIAKPLFGARWSEAIGEALGEIPNEMGLTWALGMVIDRSFETAQGVILEEAINKQKRPNRVEWQQARVLLRQGLLDDKDMQDIFEAQGFPDKQITWLKQLADQTIPIGDVAQLWYRDEIDEKTAKQLIYALGFNDTQVDWLYDLYIAKADNSASATYRSIARQMYTNHLMTEEQYRLVLADGNYPQKMIDEEVKGIQLEQSIGRVLHSVSEIKTRYLHKAIDAQEATKELRELNYADAYITDLLQSWNLGPVRKTHGLSQAKILSYMISGVISPHDAEPQLLATGLDQDTVTFLIAHPTANNGVHLHARSPGLVTNAYVDGVITQDALPAAYKSAGVADADVSWYVNVAKYRLSHRRGSPTYTQVLTAADYRAAFKAGIIDFQQCVNDLEQVGYSPDAAMLLTEITNKGPLEKPAPPAFNDIAAAYAFLQGQGYTITPPPDPRIAAAEGMLIQAGYSFYQPYNPNPLQPIVPPTEGTGGG
jgi:hypothetical protein